MKPILSPKIDLVFKLLFVRDAGTLANLIDCVLDLPEGGRIRSAEVKNPAIPAEEIGKKFIVLDIKAEDESGRRFDVEMQARKYASYSRRSVYYLCKLYAEQLNAGDDYAELKPVVGIHFLDYEEFEGCADFHFRFSFTDLRHPEIRLTDDLVLHIVEMPVFERTKPENVKPELAEWIRFFNNAEHETEETMTKNYANPHIRKTFYALKALSADDETRQRAETRERALKDEVSELNAARREGVSEGVRQGKRDGKREGERDGMLRLIFATLELRFGTVPDATGERLKGIDDADVLASVQMKAITAGSLDEFEGYLSSL